MECFTLRKQKCKQELIQRRTLATNDASKHLICPFKLKSLPEEIIENFRINNENLEYTVPKTFQYLDSNILDEIKFGAFLIRRYFSIIVAIDDKLQKEQGKKYDYYIDIFIDNGLSKYIDKIFNNNIHNIQILSELSWALINITYFPTKKNGYGYIKEFGTSSLIDGYIKLIKLGEPEIIRNLYNFLINCIIEDDDFGKEILEHKNSELIKESLLRYLCPVRNQPFDLEEKRVAMNFYVSLSKVSYLLTPNRKKTFFDIYEKIFELGNFDPGTLSSCTIGLRYLFMYDNAENKTIFNIIIKNDFSVFDKLFTSSVLDRDEYSDAAIFNISKFTQQFINLASDEEVYNLVMKTKILDFIQNYYQKIFLKNVHNNLLDILISLTRNSIQVIKLIVNESMINNVILPTLKDISFEIRKNGLNIVTNILSVNSVDISIKLFQNQIIDQIINDNLLNEVDPSILNYILTSLQYFVLSLKQVPIEHAKEAVNNIKIKINNNIENDGTRFNEEQINIINQLKSEINNILETEK